MAKKVGPVQGVAAALVRVPFEGESLEAISEGGKVWVSIRRVSEALGLSHSKQLRKLKGKPWACVALKATQIAGDDQAREVAMVDLDALPMWLATVEAARVAEGVRPKLIAYQQKAAAVLRDHFFGRPVEPPAPPAPVPLAPVERDEATSRYAAEVLQKHGIPLEPPEGRARVPRRGRPLGFRATRRYAAEVLQKHGLPLRPQDERSLAPQGSPPASTPKGGAAAGDSAPLGADRAADLRLLLSRLEEELRADVGRGNHPSARLWLAQVRAILALLPV